MATSGGFVDAATLGDVLDADVCVIGSGAGGAVTAAGLQKAGRKVVVLEEGGHHTKAEFRMREDEAFPMLYQEGGTRATKDLGVAILQGRAVGGSTVVNWTTSFRTPDKVLDHWRTVHAVGGFAKADLDPHWDAVEQRLNIQRITLEEANRNNRLLWDGCKATGLEPELLRRNTKGCFKSGYCGMGCPVDAKQSMLITYLPDAIADGALVVSRCHVDRLVVEAGKVARAECTVIGDDGYAPTAKNLVVRAKRFILSAGAIGTPSILLRSALAPTGGMVGRRTFLHPVVGVSGLYADAVEPYYGAPQSVASHALAERGDDVGLFFETAPLHPMLAAISTTGFGGAHHLAVTELPRRSAHIALCIDGFHPSETGGTVTVRPSGAPMIEYDLPPRIWAAMKVGLRALIRINLGGRGHVGVEQPRAAHHFPERARSGADRSGAVRPQPHLRLLGARHGRRHDGRRSGALGRAVERPAPPHHRQFARRRRLGVPHQPGRQPAADDLRPGRI